MALSDPESSPEVNARLCFALKSPLMSSLFGCQVILKRSESRVLSMIRWNDVRLSCSAVEYQDPEPNSYSERNMRVPSR
jgi:hypothetical protein